MHRNAFTFSASGQLDSMYSDPQYARHLYEFHDKGLLKTIGFTDCND